MDVLREREVKDSLERQLTEEQKLRSEFLLPFLAPSKIVLSRVKQHASKSISTTKKQQAMRIYNRQPFLLFARVQQTKQIVFRT